MIEDKVLDDSFLRFLTELNAQSKGDQSAQVSMYDVGHALGLEKDHASHTAEELIAMGLIEIRTLSGGIGITAEGQLHVQAQDHTSSQDQERLSPGPIMNGADIALIESLLLQIKAAINEMGLAYEELNELMADLRTVDTQLLSPQPKTAIVKACLNSIGDALGSVATESLEGRVRSIASEA